ncbi:polymer-forming cytoskeletal protein [Ferrovibrio sp. MS7]|uniref:bactofilin family protein n=1 Tax=Ferrovibrio plantarum TaxID=3119164 RepID=UPI001B6113D7|nr:polymer-forming cytoskeletal protein [Ferrovibrio sp.]
MFGRKKPSEEAANLPPAPPPKPPVAVLEPQAAVAVPVKNTEDGKTASEDLPPLPLHMQRFGKPSLPANSQAPTISTNPTASANPTISANQGSTMSDNPSSTPTFRPEIAKRPAMDLGAKPAAPAAPAMPAIASVVATSNSTSSRSESPEPKVLIIGREISLTGQITACDKVVVEGKVEATLTDSRFVEIAETGQFKGSAEIEEAEVRGKFEGKLSVRGRLLIRGTGKVMGEIAYGQIEVECGGELSGTVQTVAAGNRLSSSVAAE